MSKKLIVFDADGTLVDSQHALIEAMRAGFRSVGREVPSRNKLVGVAGLTPRDAFARLMPFVNDAELSEMALGYRHHYFEMHSQSVDGTALFPDVRNVLESLSDDPRFLVGLATGKSEQATKLMLEQFELDRIFDTVQFADRHPSKPHPSMLTTALSETATTPENAVVVGDTTADIQMAKTGGVTAIGVSWGFHSAEALKLQGAVCVIDRMTDLTGQLENIWGGA